MNILLILTTLLCTDAGTLLEQNKCQEAMLPCIREETMNLDEVLNNRDKFELFNTCFYRMSLGMDNDW